MQVLMPAACSRFAEKLLVQLKTTTATVKTSHGPWLCKMTTTSFCLFFIHIFYLEMEIETSAWGGAVELHTIGTFHTRPVNRIRWLPPVSSPAHPTAVTADPQAQRWGPSREGWPPGDCSTDQRIKHCRFDIFFKEEIKKSLSQTRWMGTH